MIGAVSASTYDWWDDAACQGVGPDAFEFRSPYQRRICASCPVMAECLEAALREEAGKDRHTRYYIRGGLTPNARYNLAIKRGERVVRRGREYAA